MSNIKWYRLDNILKYKAQYYIIFGERSNGKTYATLEYAIDRFFSHGEKLGYIKRYAEDVKSTYMQDVFNHLEHYLLDKYEKKIKFYRGQWLLYDKNSDGKISDCEVFGYAFSLASSNRYKGTSYPEVDIILFEEFMSMDCSYLNDEINLLLNLVSTIARNRTTVKVIMLANAISKYSPYFTALGIKVHRLKKGSITLKTFTDSEGYKTSFAIERTENVNVFNNIDNKEKIVYNIFGNSGVGKMITSGDFETHKYPTTINNYAFEECKIKGTKKIGKKYSTSLIIRFEDYYYRIYIILDSEKNIIAFREVDEKNIKEKNTTHIINGNKYIKGVVNIYNIMSFDGGAYNEIIDIIIKCINQRDYIVMCDDDGENVINGFRLSGLNYQHK